MTTHRSCHRQTAARRVPAQEGDAAEALRYGPALAHSEHLRREVERVDLGGRVGSDDEPRQVTRRQVARPGGQPSRGVASLPQSRAEKLGEALVRGAGLVEYEVADEFSGGGSEDESVAVVADGHKYAIADRADCGQFTVGPRA
jgi:hypothetical protein